MQLRIARPDHEVAKTQVDADTRLAQLKNITPDQAAQWVESNVNSLADAKDLLKALAKLSVYLLKRDL